MTDTAAARGIALALCIMLAACGSKFGERKTLFGSDDTVTVAKHDPGYAAMALKWDLNSDGAVTCDEWKGYMAPLFQRLDANGDGNLDAIEFAGLEPLDRLFKGADLTVFDTNFDARLSRQELLDKPNPVFVRLDRNTDCRLAPEELRPETAASPQSARESYTSRRSTSQY